MLSSNPPSSQYIYIFLNEFCIEIKNFFVLDNESLLGDSQRSSLFKEDEDKGIDVPFVALERILSATNNFSEDKNLEKEVLALFIRY